MVSSTAAVLQIAVLALVAIAAALPPFAVADEAKKPEPPAAVAEPRPQSELQTTPATGESKDVSILKQINKVNDDGSYTFGYEASDGSFKVETRDVAGNVKGMFGFVDEAGRLKRVSYSASNSSGFRATAAGSASPPHGGADAAEPSPRPPSARAEPPRKQEDDGDGEPAGGKSTSAVKKVLVSKRPVMTVMAREEADRPRGGNDLRRQLSRNDENDAPDVYGVHDRSSPQSGPVSPVVSALMSELDPARSYRPIAPGPQQPQDAYGAMATAAYEAREDSISRQAQEDDEPATPQYRAVPNRQPVAAYQQSAVYPLLTPVAFQQQPVAPAYPAAYGPNLAALRDELMELILSFVQTRVSQLMSVASYRHQPQLPIHAYPMPYQQPNYYVPSYYQGPRVSGSAAAQQFGGRQQLQDSYAAAAAAAAAQQQSSPRVTQTLKDGLIRMLLSTSPRYDPERAPRLSYRQTTQPTTPVRSVQIIGEDSRPVTTETPD